MRFKTINLARGELGEMLRDMRETTGLSQRKVVQEVKVGKGQLSAYETSSAIPNVWTFQKLLKFYGYKILVVRDEK